MSSYAKFLESKRMSDPPTGLATVPELNSMLFDFQRDIVRWALRRGRAAIFADCGMGKTPMQLEWAHHIPGRVLIAAPLAVASQTCREAEKFGIDGVQYLRSDDGETRIVVTNYEMLDRFRPAEFAGVVLDESSILKSYTGKYRNHLVREWGTVRYRLAATATPAPNDFMELGSHAEFLGVMTGSEMLSSFFINDPSKVGTYRLKGHATKAFWEWMAGWSTLIRKPSDLGYDDGNFILPELRIHQETVSIDHAPDGMLFALDAHTMGERQAARRNSIAERVARVAEKVNALDGPAICWCDLNAESEALCRSIRGAVEVRGSDKPEVKESRLLGFSNGEFRVLVTKPKIAGFGMNWQHCSNVFFTGLSDSYEQFYQAVRRCWRFGQKKPVECVVVTASNEGAVVANILRKERQAETMAAGMVKNTAHLTRGHLIGNDGFAKAYIAPELMAVPDFLKAS